MRGRLDETTARRMTARSERELLGFLALCMGMMAMSIDLVLPAFPAMRQAFGLADGANEVAQVVTAFMVGLGLGQLIYGPLSDRFGRKPMLYAGVAVYITGAGASMLADSLGALIMCRVIWGLGAAGPYSLALVILRDTYEGDRMARAVSKVTARWLVVPVIAPAIGLGLVSIGGWRAVLVLPILAAIVLGAWAWARLPESLPPDQRRSVSPAALREAAGAVVRSRQTVAFTAAATFLFGIVASYAGSAQVIIDQVLGQKQLFPVIFGMTAVVFALASLLCSRLVVRVGLDRLVRGGLLYTLAASSALAAVGVVTGGRPPIWVYLPAVVLVLPAVVALVPNCNAAAIAPLPHVAGMASAFIGTTATVGGALLGGVVDASYDDTARPFTIAVCIFASAAFALVFLVGRPSSNVAVELMLEGAVLPALVD